MAKGKISYNAQKSCERLGAYVESEDGGWKTYRKKTTIQAKKMPVAFTCDTLEGDNIRGKAGDYLAKGIKGELYPIAADVFHESYEEVPEEELKDDKSED